MVEKINFKKIIKKIFLTSFFVFCFLFSTQNAFADLTPDSTISTCGVMGAAGTYTLSGGDYTVASPCFTITSTGVIIDAVTNNVTPATSFDATGFTFLFDGGQEGRWSGSTVVGGNVTLLNSSGSGSDGTHYYISNIQTTLDSNGNGNWDSGSGSHYYIGGAQTTLNSSGTGLWDNGNGSGSLFYLAGSVGTGGWNGTHYQYGNTDTYTGSDTDQYDSSTRMWYNGSWLNGGYSGTHYTSGQADTYTGNDYDYSYGYQGSQLYYRTGSVFSGGWNGQHFTSGQTDNYLGSDTDYYDSSTRMWYSGLYLNGGWNGQHFTSGQGDTYSGYDYDYGNNSPYYFISGQSTTLDSGGNGYWNGVYYAGGAPAPGVTVSGNTWTVDGVNWSYDGSPIGFVNWVFKNGARNSGTIYGNAVFDDTSSNSGYVMTGHGIFFSGASDTSSGGVEHPLYLSASTGIVWTNAANDGDVNNPANWLNGVRSDDGGNIVLLDSFTLPDTISNNIYPVVDGITINGGTHTLNGYINGNFTGGRGTSGHTFTLQDITVTGIISSAGDTAHGGAGGTITIQSSSSTLDLSNEVVNTASTLNINFNNDFITNTGTASSTAFYNIGNLVINSSNIGSWNDFFNLVGHYFYDGVTSLHPSATSDGNWNNPNNWYKTSSYDQAGTIPHGFDEVFINSSVTQNAGDPTPPTAQADTVVVNGNSTIGIPIDVARGITFNDGSSNANIITNGGPTTFNATSTNTGTTTSTGAVTFNASSSNSGLIITASSTTFNGNDASSTGLITDNLNASFGWKAIASDLSGQHLVAAVNGGQIYTSSDYGVTWTPRDSARSWYSVASDSSGKYLAAVVQGGKIYTSNDYGVTWTPHSSSSLWTSVASDSSGQYLVATSYNSDGQSGQIYTSNDYGATWIPRNSSLPWYAVSSDSTGKYLAVAAPYNSRTHTAGGIYISNDYGVTWTPTNAPTNILFDSIASDSTGSNLVAVAQRAGAQIFTSSNGGTTWTARDSARYWLSVASDSSGQHLVAVVNGGYIYTASSTLSNYGVTWTPRDSSRNWTSVTSNSTGQYLVAVVQGGKIYTSNDYGVTWTPQSIPDTSNPVTRIFTTAVATTNNFLTEAGHNNWIVVAQGVAVDISGAVYNTAANVFKAIMDPITHLFGSFFVGSNSGGQVVPQITVANIIPYTGATSTETLKWNPSIDWDTAVNGGTCLYSYNNDYSNPTTVTCSHNDTTSLSRPGRSGSRTVYFRAIDAHGDVSETSFTYYYDNRDPVWTTCGADQMDEASRPYYYLASTVNGNCTATVNTTLYGTSATTSTTGGNTLNGSLDTTGHNITLKNITVTNAITSDGGDITLQNAITSSTTTASGVSNGQAGGTITVSTSTVAALVSNGYPSTSGSGGQGGHITVGTSTTAIIIANGATSTTDGGRGGVINVWNSDGVASGTSVTANGGDSKGCGDGGAGGTITLNDYTNYVTSNVGGDGSSSTCSSTHHNSGGSGTVNTNPRPTPPSNNSNNNSTPAPTRSGGGASAPVLSYNPLSNPIVLPVNQLTPLNLKALPTFGSGTNPNAKGTFSFIGPVTNFLFTPLPKTIVISPELKKFLDDNNITGTQALVSLANKPLILPVPPPLGLFTVTTENLSISNPFADKTNKKVPAITTLKTYLSSDSKYNLLQLVSVLPSTKINITLKGAKTGTYNSQAITFTNGSATITTPKKVGRYYVVTSDSSVPLAIDIKTQTNFASQNLNGQASLTSSANPITNVITNVGNWFSSWFH